jgi:hypothetical protein
MRSELFGAFLIFCSVRVRWLERGGVNILEDVRHSSVLYVCKYCASDYQKLTIRHSSVLYVCKYCASDHQKTNNFQFFSGSVRIAYSRIEFRCVNLFARYK